MIIDVSAGELNAIYLPLDSYSLVSSARASIFFISLQKSSTARERDLAMVERGGENGSAVEDGAVPGDLEDPRLQGISAAIRVVPHFPKPGLLFFSLP